MTRPGGMPDNRNPVGRGCGVKPAHDGNGRPNSRLEIFGLAPQAIDRPLRGELEVEQDNRQAIVGSEVSTIPRHVLVGPADLSTDYRKYAFSTSRK